MLFYAELLGLIGGGIAAVIYLVRRPTAAPVMLGVGVLTLVLATIFYLLAIRWFPSDNTGIGLLGLAIVLGPVGCLLVLASIPSTCLRQHGGGARAHSDGAPGSWHR